MSLYGGPSETSAIEFCHEIGNPSLEKLINIKVIHIIRQGLLRQQNFKRDVGFTTGWQRRGTFLSCMTVCVDLFYDTHHVRGGGGGGGTPLHKPCRYVPAQRVGFLRRFGLKTGIHFTHFGPAVIGYGFQWNYDSVRTYLTPIE